jgi:uncharacterized phosphatase
VILLIYVVRHGRTNWNKEGRLQGRQGLPLNEEGLLEAENVRDRLKKIRFDYVFSSPQERAIQTAEIATGIKPLVDPRLDVFDLGEADGLRRSEVQMVGAIPDPHQYKGVEEPSHFIKRVFAFMQELKANHGTDNVNIFISGHRCTTGCIGAYFSGNPADSNMMRYSSNNGDYKSYTFNPAQS